MPNNILDFPTIFVQVNLQLEGETIVSYHKMLATKLFVFNVG